MEDYESEGTRNWAAKERKTVGKLKKGLGLCYFPNQLVEIRA